MTGNWTERRVVVTGLGVVSSLGHNIDTFWNNLIAGRCGIDNITAIVVKVITADTRFVTGDVTPVPQARHG